MKSNVQSRVKTFDQDLEKFSARWHQLKPGDDALDGDKEKCEQALKVIKEKRQEFKDLDDAREKLMLVIKYYKIWCVYIWKYISIMDHLEEDN